MTDVQILANELRRLEQQLYAADVHNDTVRWEQLTNRYNHILAQWHDETELMAEENGGAQ